RFLHIVMQLVGLVLRGACAGVQRVDARAQIVDTLAKAVAAHEVGVELRWADIVVGAAGFAGGCATKRCAIAPDACLVALVPERLVWRGAALGAGSHMVRETALRIMAGRPV